MNCLRHPNVVLLLGACQTPPTLAIIMEYVAGGSLHQVRHSQLSGGRGGFQAWPSRGIPQEVGGLGNVSPLGKYQPSPSPRLPLASIVVQVAYPQS